MTEFLSIEPSLEDYYRALILFGKNVACYKLALGKALLELAPKGKTVISLEELAEPYSRHVTEHLKLSDAQNQGQDSYPFLDACRQFNQGDISNYQLLTITAKEGFKVVLDKFHNLSGYKLPIRFYEKKKGEIILTDELLKLAEVEQFNNLSSEVEARWRLIETAWTLQISRNLVEVNYDHDLRLLFAYQNNRRIDVTSCRDSLNGYQKGKCFYCFAPLCLNIVDVDHFLPHRLKRFINSVDGCWNLVLACSSCNRGVKGKFDRLPHLDYLKRLHTRNEFLISSHHPLRDTLIQQTGKTVLERTNFLNVKYNEAQRLLGTKSDLTWRVLIEYPQAF